MAAPPEMEITRDHWMPEAAVHQCSNPKCGRRFGALLRKQHCFCCGLVFCTQCVSHVMPLDPATAQIDLAGIKAFVCSLCYQEGLDQGINAEGTQTEHATSEEDFRPGSLEEAIFHKPPSFPLSPKVQAELTLDTGIPYQGNANDITGAQNYQKDNNRLQFSHLKDTPSLQMDPLLPLDKHSSLPAHEPQSSVITEEEWRRLSNEQRASDSERSLGWEEDYRRLSFEGNVPSSSCEGRPSDWTVEEVAEWLREEVKFSKMHRGQEYAKVFCSAEVNGKDLHSLRRNSKPCDGMAEEDWQLFKAARKRLFASAKGPLTRSATAPQTRTQPIATERNHRSSDPSLLSHSPPLPVSGVSQGGKNKGWLNGLVGRLSGAQDVELAALTVEVQSLRGELTSAEEREATIEATLEHLDDTLRTATLAEYLDTRTTWTESWMDAPNTGAKAGEDDWLPRFLVLKENILSYYFRAKDRGPQGTVLLEHIRESGALSNSTDINSSLGCGFYIATVDGLRLECRAKSKFKMELWLMALGEKMCAKGQ